MGKHTFIITFVAVTTLVLLSTQYYSKISISGEFEAFVAKYQKNYLSLEEYEFRKSIFDKNLDYINKFNAEGHTWWLGVNKFTDLTDEEFKQYLGYKPNNGEYQPLGTIEAPKVPVNDEEIDWRKKGYVYDVKNQGSCGSCWAFAANFGVEAAWVKYNELEEHKKVSPPNLAEQLLVDCDYENGGCLGGIMQYAYHFYTQQCPVVEDDYPYEGIDAECRSEGKKCAVPEILGWYDVTKYNDEALRHSLSLTPLIVGIQAENMDFRAYAGGIISGTKCGYRLDHGVGLAGEYFKKTTVNGVEKKQPVWIVKNSWGTDWGKDGYVDIARENIDIEGHNVGVCGINMDPSFPTYVEYYH